MEGQEHPKQTEYFADGNTNPQTAPWSPLWHIHSAPGRGEGQAEGAGERQGEGFLRFSPQRPGEETGHPQTAKKCSFLRKCSYKERARKSLSNIY